MARTATRKEDSHDRIVRAASRAIRERGYDGISVADVMKEAGLTHGGFYAHFDSKTALLAEAADTAGADGIHRLTKAVGNAPRGEALGALIDAYLSQQHLDSPATGCVVAAMGSEMPRQEPAVRQAATRRIRDLIGLVERQMPDWGKPGSHEKAMAILAGLVGTMVLARAVDDPELARSMRKASRQFLRRA